MLAASNQPEDLEGDYDSSDELPVPIAIDLNSFEPSREGKDAGEWNVERFRVAQNCTKKDNEEEKDTESIFSQGSFASSATYYFEDITAAVDEFASLLSHDPVLEPVFATVFRGDSSSAETSMLFTNKLHLVLREYSRVLKFQAAGSLERTSAKLVGLHSRRIANYIREEFEASDTAQDYVRDVLTQNDTQHIRSVWLGNSSESEEDEDDFQPPEYEREPNLHPFSLSQVKDYLISGNHYQTPETRSKGSLQQQQVRMPAMILPRSLKDTLIIKLLIPSCLTRIGIYHYSLKKSFWRHRKILDLSSQQQPWVTTHSWQRAASISKKCFQQLAD